MAERLHGQSINSADYQKPRDFVWDLSPLEDKVDFDQTVSFLNQAKDKFAKENWRGGIHGGYSLDDIVQLFTAIHKKVLSTKNPKRFRITSDAKLAMMEAILFADIDGELKGLNTFLEILREKAKEEIEPSQSSDKSEKDSIKGNKKGHSRLRKTLPFISLTIPVVIALATKPWETFQTPNPILNGDNNQSRQAETSFNTDEDIQVENNQGLPESISSFFQGVSESIPPLKRIPPVEELNELTTGPFTLWGINLSKEVTIIWDYPEIIKANGDKSLTYTISNPKIISDRITFPSSGCLNSPTLDSCIMNIDGITYRGGHTAWFTQKDGNMQDFGFFVEGGSKEKSTEYFSQEAREERISLLENNRPTISGENHEAKAQVAIVRIQEADKDAIYDDWNKALPTALKYNPDLPNQINLEKPILVDVTCGRRLPGDKKSPHNQNLASGSLYLIIYGESPTNQG